MTPDWTYWHRNDLVTARLMIEHMWSMAAALYERSFRDLPLGYGLVAVPLESRGAEFVPAGDGSDRHPVNPMVDELGVRIWVCWDVEDDGQPLTLGYEPAPRGLFEHALQPFYGDVPRWQELACELGLAVWSPEWEEEQICRCSRRTIRRVTNGCED